jgi:hypothetical protein
LKSVEVHAPILQRGFILTPVFAPLQAPPPVLFALIFKRISASAPQRISASAHQRISASAHQRISASAHQRISPQKRFIHWCTMR